jgi:CheY-like chemotaxis protein
MFSAPRVLLIEDSMAVRRMVQLALSGLQVTAEASGQSGLAAARREPPELVILADTLPDIATAAFCAALTEDERLRGVRVVLLTTRRTDEALAPFQDSRNVVDAVRKPFLKDSLAEVIHRILADPAPAADEGVSDWSPTAEQVQAATRALFASFREGLGHIPAWIAQLNAQQPSAFFGERLLTDQAVARLLRRLAPLFRAGESAPSGIRPVAVWADRARLRPPLADLLRRRHGLTVLSLGEETERVAVLVRQRPHLIIVDVESAGSVAKVTEFVRAVRAVPELSKMNIVLLARPQTSLPTASDLNCQAILVKPFQVRDLEAWLPSRAADSTADRKSAAPQESMTEGPSP